MPVIDLVPYLVYFLGPFLLAVFLGKRWLGANYPACAFGLLAFLAAWICVMTVTATAATLSDAFKEGALVYAVVVSASAGLFEESARFFAFRLFGALRERKSWNTGIMYAIGHSGMESFIVGGSLLLTVAVVTHAPQYLTPEILEQVRPVLETGFWSGLYSAFQRLFVGLLIHACFTLVVLLGVITAQRKYLFLAMLWHFGHDMVAFNLERLSGHWIAGASWIAFIVVVYTWALLRLRTMIAGLGKQDQNYP